MYIDKITTRITHHKSAGTSEYTELRETVGSQYQVDAGNSWSSHCESHCLERPRIVVIAPNMSQPRYHRRVEAILSAGYIATVYSFEREYYKCNVFPPGCELINLGRVKDGHYFERIFTILDVAQRIWFMEQKRYPASLVYAFGLDCAVLGSIVVKAKTGIIYEVGDIRSPTLGQGVFGRAVQIIEDILLRSCSLLVNTSAAFMDSFFKKRYRSLKHKTLIIENKIPKSIFGTRIRSIDKPSTYPLNIGYIGLLRYENTFTPLLKSIAKHKDRYSLHIYGDGPLRSNAEQNATEHANIHYYGPFKNPDDLASIYNSIDLCYVVYDNNDLNVRLALPNKLYESTYFCVPMLVATETALYERVKEWDIGWAVDPNKKDFLDKFFSELSLDDIDQKKRNAATIRQSYIVEDWTELHYCLQSLVINEKVNVGLRDT